MEGSILFSVFFVDEEILGAVSSESSNGFLTSLATLMMTSNFAASARVGSE